MNRCGGVISLKHLFTKTRYLRGFKDPRLGLRQFLATESALKMMENVFYFTLRSESILSSKIKIS